MSLHYGVSKYTYETIKIRVINYQIVFEALAKSKDSVPRALDDGYPFARLYCKGHHPDGGFKILSHRFDKDHVLSPPLTIRLKIRIALSDGTVQLIDLEDVDYYGADIARCESSYFLEKEFKFKDIPKQGTRDILAFDVVFQQLTGESYYGNESVMDIAVDY